MSTEERRRQIHFVMAPQGDVKVVFEPEAMVAIGGERPNGQIVEEQHGIMDQLAIKLIGATKQGTDGYVINAAFVQRALGRRPEWLKVIK